MENNIIEMIEDWRVKFGLPVNKNKYTPTDEELALDVRLIQEECDELSQAHRELEGEELRTELIDACIDQYFVTTQLLNRLGVNISEAVKRVYDSNMSKLCTSMEEVNTALELYSSKGVEATYKEIEPGLFIILRKSDNKVLKGPNFFEPDLRDL